MVRVATLTAVACLIVFPITAQNLLVNPGFDFADQIAGWTCVGNDGMVTWSPLDRMGSGASGSLQVDIAGTETNASLTCNQCVPVNEFNSYAASTWINWPDDIDVTQDGTSRIRIGFYSDAGCTTSIEWGPISFAYYPGQPLGTWIHFSTAESIAPAGSVAARLFITTWQDLANEPVRVRIDDFDFRTTTIFHDGFESGGTTAWEP